MMCYNTGGQNFEHTEWPTFYNEIPLLAQLLFLYTSRTFLHEKQNVPPSSYGKSNWSKENGIAVAGLQLNSRRALAIAENHVKGRSIDATIIFLWQTRICFSRVRR